MVRQVVLAFCLVLGMVSHLTSAQWFGNMGTQSQAQIGGLWQSASLANNWGNVFQQDNTRYLTCIAKNSNNDEMRVTFSTGSSSNNPWDRRRFGTRNLRLAARVTSGSGSPFQGLFQLVVTEYSRSEKECSSRALGEILNDRSWWSQSNTARGIVGNTIRIRSGQISNSAESVEGLEFQELAGRGLALCQSHQIRGSICVDPISLCCKIGYDTQPATESFAHQGHLFSQGMQSSGFGLNQGTSGSFNQGVAGVGNSGMDGGMNRGMNDQFNQGMRNFGLGMNGGLNSGQVVGGLSP